MSIRQIIRWTPAAAVLFVLAGCPSGTIEQPEVDASVSEDAEPRDADSEDASEPSDTGPKPDAGFTVRSMNLAPASGTATSTIHRVSGALRASEPGPARSTRHELRGRIGPLSP